MGSAVRPPRPVWECRATEHGDDLDDLREALLRYVQMPGARLMTSAQVVQTRRLTPLERALTPARR